MKSAKQHYEEWKHVFPTFTEEQKRKLYFMMNDYARDYRDRDVKELNTPDISISLERAKKYGAHQHYRGTIKEPLVEFEDWEAKD